MKTAALVLRRRKGIPAASAAGHFKDKKIAREPETAPALFNGTFYGKENDGRPVPRLSCGRHVFAFQRRRVPASKTLTPSGALLTQAPPDTGAFPTPAHLPTPAHSRPEDAPATGVPPFPERSRRTAGAAKPDNLSGFFSPAY